MINRRFLNFETYEEFLSKLPEIPQDSIVFVQSKPCIWTHGKEYVCSDSDAYVLNSIFNESIATLTSKDNEILSALNSKAAIDTLGEYSKTSTVLSWLNNKQDKLSPGTGISIDRSTNTIYSTLDTEPYVVVQSLPTEGNPNKIYLLQSSNLLGNSSLEQWKYNVSSDYNTFPIVLTDGSSLYGNGGWIRLGSADLGINLALYAEKEQLDSLLNDIIANYATIEYVQSNYTTRVYSDLTYVKLSDIYTPSQEGSVSGEIDNLGEGDTPAIGSYNRLITIPTTTYQLLVDTNQVDPNTYYFTYEVENEPLGLGMFPINLT